MNSNTNINGILIINKPQNFTSFDVIGVLRKKFNQKKIGHMGTLDPMATGVLPVLLGSSTKFQVYAPDNYKEYICEIKFGVTTDTWDIWGKILNTKKSNISREDLVNILEKFTGEIKQIPPMYSAIKQNGVKLCNLARRGIEIERPARSIIIKNINLLSFDKINQTAQLKILCSKGTYIRSLCHDIGQELHTDACMSNLIRTMSNSFSISQSVFLDKIKVLNTQDIVQNYIFNTEKLFQNFKSLELNSFQTRLFLNGVSILLKNLDFNNKNITNKEILKIYFKKKFLGLAQADFDKQILKFEKFI